MPCSLNSGQWRKSLLREALSPMLPAGQSSLGCRFLIQAAMGGCAEKRCLTFLEICLDSFSFVLSWVPQGAPSACVGTRDGVWGVLVWGACRELCRGRAPLRPSKTSYLKTRAPHPELTRCSFCLLQPLQSIRLAASPKWSSLKKISTSRISKTRGRFPTLFR